MASCRKLGDCDRAILNSIFNPLLPTGEAVFDEDIPQELRAEEPESDDVKKAKAIEERAVALAESGKFAEARALFDDAIAVVPARASGYNNRAQCLRLQGDVHGALKDLDEAIQLSDGRGKAACQAYTQRGLIRRFEGDDDKARSDFEKAAALGSEFANTQIVAMNPYAALCNQMLSEAFAKLQRGERDDKS